MKKDLTLGTQYCERGTEMQPALDPMLYDPSIF